MSSPFSIVGGMFGGGEPMRPDVNKDYTSGDDNNYVMPSIVPYYMFDGKMPPFMSGSGYLLPKETLPCLFKEGRNLRDGAVALWKRQL